MAYKINVRTIVPKKNKTKKNKKQKKTKEKKPKRAI